MTARAVRRRLLLLSATLLLGLIGAGGYLGWRVWQAQGDLTAAAGAAQDARTALAGGDVAGARAAVGEMTDRAAEVEVDGDPIWRLAEGLPVVGGNLTAVRVAASGLARLGAEVAGPLIDVSVMLRTSRTAQLSEALRAAAPSLETADRVRADVQDAIAKLDRAGLAGELHRGVERLDELLAEIAPATTAVAEAARILPSMLGADGPRTVLVMIQNTAELRTGGGITGTFLQLDVVDGVVTLGEIRDSAQFPVTADPLLPVPAAEERSFGDGIGRFVQNASMTSDFSLTARLASAWWQSTTGVVPDLVVSIVPLVWDAVLAVIGPVPLSDGSVGAGEVVEGLLVRPYLVLDAEEQSARFADVASAAFTAVFGREDLLPVVLALREPIAEGRISMWSAIATEEDALAGTALAGPRARQEQAGPDAFAVYFNDMTGGKVTPYLQVGLGTASAVCRPDRRPEVVVAVHLANTLMPEDVAALPISVTGGGIWGAGVGDIALAVTIVTPSGWFLEAVQVDGTEVANIAVDDDGRLMVTRRTDIHPDGARDMVFRFVAGDAGSSRPVLLHTPLLQEPAAAAAVPVCD
ncbi:MAG: DUF4012 domain-containing protein [Microbacterium sp.]|uniref:DUF4012 domain-containing protein n=1 Tax=Microbacterium sp. TaxID=51671 RepID=UPI002608F2BC|nr:DUF4012 domain-containing protein [Microbacterium sp.]MCX6502424.1 DUF4012 domain-containing protein [Microbacterium sp.]